jgi:ParB-like chromosome segregation protein Spo0J
MTYLLSTAAFSIGLDLIDAGERTFSLAPSWLQSDALVASIARVGICSPIHVQKLDDGMFRIVSGFKRFQASQSLGRNEILCLEVETGCPDLELMSASIWENAAFRSFLEVEKAYILKKLSSKFGVVERDLIEEYLPVLDIKPDRFNLQRYLALAELPEFVQSSVGRVELEVALKAGRWPVEEQEFLIDVVDRYRLGRNKQRKLFELLDELKAIAVLNGKGSLVVDIWDDCGARDVDEGSSADDVQKYNRISDCLLLARFPKLIEHRKRAEELKSALRIPTGLQLTLPTNFEGSRIEVHLSVRNAVELSEYSDNLLRISRQEELVALFELL